MFINCISIKRKKTKILPGPDSHQVLIPQRNRSESDQLKFFLIASRQIKNHTTEVASVR